MKLDACRTYIHTQLWCMHVFLFCPAVIFTQSDATVRSSAEQPLPPSDAPRFRKVCGHPENDTIGGGKKRVSRYSGTKVCRHSREETMEWNGVPRRFPWARHFYRQMSKTGCLLVLLTHGSPVPRLNGRSRAKDCHGYRQPNSMRFNIFCVMAAPWSLVLAPEYR